MSICTLTIAVLLVLAMLAAPSSARAAETPGMVATMLGNTGVVYDIIEGQFKCVDRANGAYFAMHQSSELDSAPGYAGFQFRDGRSWTIMSLWHTPTGSARIEYAPKDAIAHPFTGEGDGMQVLVPYKWDLGIWYTMRIQAVTVGGRTHFEQWVMPENGSWTKLAVISFSKPNLGFKLNRFFLEDFAHSGLQSSCQLRGYYARRASDHKWKSLTEYEILNTNEKMLNYSFCLTDQATVFIQSGGSQLGVRKAPATLTVRQDALPDTTTLLGH